MELGTGTGTPSSQGSPEWHRISEEFCSMRGTSLGVLTEALQGHCILFKHFWPAQTSE